MSEEIIRSALLPNVQFLMHVPEKSIPQQKQHKLNHRNPTIRLQETTKISLLHAGTNNLHSEPYKKHEMRKAQMNNLLSISPTVPSSPDALDLCLGPDWPIHYIATRKTW
jgi:hypothetical protein